METEKTERTIKFSFKKVVMAVLFAFVATAFALAGFCFSKTEVKAEGEAVEVMNDHFTVTASVYRTDFATDQAVVLTYDKQFHGTATWLNDKADGIADGMDLGNYLVINGKTFNEIKAEEAGKYVSVDQRTQMSKGGVWTPIAVLADTTSITLQVNRGYLDIGAMTVGIKDGFNYEYNGTTFRTEGDMIFKATLNPNSNFETPVFVKQEAAEETEYKFETVKRNLEPLVDNGDYKGFRFFPSFFGDSFNSSYQTRWLADHYMYMKDYILINGKSVNYWNIVKYDETVSYFPNPIGSGENLNNRIYSTPIIVNFLNNGEYQIWINSLWAAKNGIDFNNIKFSVEKGMPFVKSDGKVYVTANRYSADTINGTTYYIKSESEIIPSVSIENVSEQTDLKHLVAEVALSKPMDDIVWHMIDGYAANAEALKRIFINGKSVFEINSTTDTTGWDWNGGSGFHPQNKALQQPVLILCNGSKMTIYINGQYRETFENGKNSDVTIEIKEGAEVLYQPSNTEAGNKYAIAALAETTIYNRTYKLSVYPEGAEGNAVESNLASGKAIASEGYAKEGYTLEWVDENGNAALTVMPARDYSIFARYTAIEYTATVEYFNGGTENLKYTIENRTQKFAEIVSKLTAATAEYEYVANVSELPLENCTVKEVRKPVEYTVTLKFADGATEEISFNVETRNSVLKELEKRLTESTDEYEYFWKGGLPEELPLENIELEAERKAKEYTLTVAYADKPEETIIFTIETRDKVLASLVEKLTPSQNGYSYAWKDLPDVLELKNQTITEEKTIEEYTLTVVYADETKPNEEIKFTVETREEVYASLKDKLSASDGEYTYSWDKSELPLEDTTITEIKAAKEYTLTIKYIEKAQEEIKFSAANREEVFNSLADKLTPDTEAYVYGWDKTELPLADTSISETREAVEYTLTIKYADKEAEKIKFTIETRDAVLASLSSKLTPSTSEFKYSWNDLPATLELKDVTVTEIKTAVPQNEKGGCGSSVAGSGIVAALCLCAAAVVIKKKKEQ